MRTRRLRGLSILNLDQEESILNLDQEEPILKNGISV